MMLELIHIEKRYQYQKVIDDISLKFPHCGLVSIVGPSGCGKSTLLHMMGGIDRNFQGDIRWNEESIKKQYHQYRRHVSFIFQQFHLIMWLSVMQNIQLSHYFQKKNRYQEELNIEVFKTQKMSSLSLGQRQRIAFLRTQYQQCDILLCDEPTGSLDPQHAQEVMELLKEESRQKLVVLVSHDMELVKKYSDEIFEMKDGHIINHHIYHQNRILPQKKKQGKKKSFRHLRLSTMSLLSHKGRNFQLILGLVLSLFCIILTLTMSRRLEQQIYDYIYSLVPASSISFQSYNHHSLSIDGIHQFEQYESISRCHLYLDDYEFLGIGFLADHYQESQTIFIGDDTSPYEDLSLSQGRYPQNKHEILVSLSTAQHLCQNEDLSSLIDKKIYAWYKCQKEIKAIEYHVVGITQKTTVLETIYQQSNAYIDLLKDVFLFDIHEVKSSLGILYVDKNYQRSEVIKELKISFPNYQYKEVGASTSQSVSEKMDKIEIVLICFSCLAILSSLFLIGEVMFLNVVQKKKDLAVMICYGANRRDLIKIVLLESFVIVLLSEIFSTLLYGGFLMVVNRFVQMYLLSHQIYFSFDMELLLIVDLLTFGLVIISQGPPLIYVFRLNTIEALKG